jgi:hypothetical protein
MYETRGNPSNVNGFLVLRHGFVCERAAGQAERVGKHRPSLRNNRQNSRLLEYQGNPNHRRRHQ